MKSEEITLKIFEALRRDGWRVKLTCDDNRWYVKAHSAAPGRPWIYGHGKSIGEASRAILRSRNQLKRETHSM